MKQDRFNREMGHQPHGHNLLSRMVMEHGSALTVSQLARILQCSKSQVYAWIEQKRLPALKVGAMIRLEPGTVAAWIEARMTTI